jgi:hypothetical protein
VLMHQSHLLPEGQILLCYPTMFCFLPILLIFPGIDARAIEATTLGIVFNNSCNISLLFFLKKLPGETKLIRPEGVVGGRPDSQDVRVVGRAASPQLGNPAHQRSCLPILDRWGLRSRDVR